MVEKLGNATRVTLRFLLAIALCYIAWAAVTPYLLYDPYAAVAQVTPDTIIQGADRQRQIDRLAGRVDSLEIEVQDLKAMKLEARLSHLEAIQSQNSSLLLSIAGGVGLLIISEGFTKLRKR